MAHRGYRFAVEWVALNDGAGDDDARSVDAVAGLVSVLLVADLYEKEPAEVARAVVRVRKREGA